MILLHPAARGTLDVFESPAVRELRQENHSSWGQGRGPYWARYIGHLEARLAELVALINRSMEDLPNPDSHPKYTDDLWSPEVSFRNMGGDPQRPLVGATRARSAA
ncbi:hypothetical protein DFH09DRAFT_1112099 [Mycena vulgaris]|nr:hypothetical protein DFH09DRAFT_1112099 [Mycena vulgaris]